jgi:hypothetical protein
MCRRYARRASEVARASRPCARPRWPCHVLAGALLLAFITSFNQPLIAQESRGTVRGAVSDPTHLAVPRAKVTLRNLGTNVDRVVATDSSGF